MTESYRAIWLSDVHLGTGVCRAAELLQFLDDVRADVLYLVGDIIDLESLKLRPRFPPVHRDVVARFLELARSGLRVVYVPGNHDIEFRRLAGRTLGGIEVELEMQHVCGDGRKMLIMHGDCLDRHIRSGSQLEQFGAAAYQWLVRADAGIHRLKTRFGQRHVSISARIKTRLKSANEYIRRFEECAAAHAAERGFDGVVCGHIHRPMVRNIDGICYANDGDWVEHRSALAETADGRLELLHAGAEPVAVEAAPEPATLAA